MFNFFKKKRKVVYNEKIRKNNELPKTTEIIVSNYENLIIVDIKENCSITDYCNYLKSINCEYLFNKIWNSTIWDSKKQQVKSNKIYYVKQNNAEYNIYNNEEKTFIVERRTIEEKSPWIEEIVITIYKEKDNYQIARLKHDETRSTFYTKFYNSDKLEETLFYLANANDIGLEMLERLNLIDNIDKIINVEEIKGKIIKEKTLLKK